MICFFAQLATQKRLAQLPILFYFIYKYLYRIKISAILLFYKLSCFNNNKKLLGFKNKNKNKSKNKYQS